MSLAITTIIGTNDSETLTGTHSHEVISGRGGDDTIYAYNGHDEAWGGTGDDLLYGGSGNDLIYGGGGPTVIDMTPLSISQTYSGRIIFEGESAGYRNSLGSYKIDGDGSIYDVTMHFDNASLQGSGGDLIGGVSESSLSMSAGDQLGFFIISNGYSYNGGYPGVDFSTGTMEFRNSDGSVATNASINPELWFTQADGSEQELIKHKYHSSAGVEDTDYNLNADGILHIKGILNTNKGTVSLGFEDLYNGGDLDFDDSVFTVDIGTANARDILPVSTPRPGVVHSDDDILYGGNGNDELYGKAGDDIHYGEGGDDEIYAGSGNDIAYGGNGNDILKGGGGDDVLYGENGADSLFGGLGDDIISGGSSADTLYGNDGDDVLDGGSGADTFYAGKGADIVTAGSGNDIVYGNDGDDVIAGEGGNDTINAGNGDDDVSGDDGSDTIRGNAGDDTLAGNDGVDTIYGDNGNDSIDGGDGADTLYGGSGNDTFVSGSGGDYVNGGSGIDTIDYSGLTESIRVDIHGKRTTGGDSDTLYSVENAIGTDFDDWFRGDKRDNTIDAGAGDDYIRGLKGDDLLTGGSGEDTFFWRSTDIGSYTDIISDFSLTDDTLQFNISSSLNLENFDDWFSISESDGDTSLFIDLDGAGSSYNSTEFALLSDVSGYSSADFSVIV